MEINYSYESSELIEDVKEDIVLFGKDFLVFALKKKINDFEYIFSYEDVLVPERNDSDYDIFDDPEMIEDEWKGVIKEYYEGLQRVVDNANSDVIRLDTLLELLIKQNKVIDGY